MLRNDGCLTGLLGKIFLQKKKKKSHLRKNEYCENQGIAAFMGELPMQFAVCIEQSIWIKYISPQNMNPSSANLYFFITPSFYDNTYMYMLTMSVIINGFMTKERSSPRENKWQKESIGKKLKYKEVYHTDCAYTHHLLLCWWRLAWKTEVWMLIYISLLLCLKKSL